MLDTGLYDPISKLSSIVAEIAQKHDVNHRIAATDHLVDSGMTSMAMVDLLLAIEAELDVTIPQREMTPSNFQSIETLAGMLRRIRELN
jgi:acyl carrier protein